MIENLKVLCLNFNREDEQYENTSNLYFSQNKLNVINKTAQHKQQKYEHQHTFTNQMSIQIIMAVRQNKFFT